jgi:ferritin
MNAKLNDQITAEYFAAHKYLAMACAFERMGLKNLSKRFMKQYGEELEHAMKIVRYVLEVGGTVTLDAIPKPPGDLKNVEVMVQMAVDGELDITRRIHDIVTLAESEKDYTTRSFMQWFVDEQVEEVSTMTDLLNWVKLAGSNVLQVESLIRHTMVES